nr:hypothetical protein [Halomonas socia]
MSKQRDTIQWSDSSSDATIKDEPRVAIEVVEPIMVGGAMVLPGQRVTNVPKHMAKLLQARGRASLAAA